MEWLKKVDIVSLILAIAIIWLLFFQDKPKDSSKYYIDYIKEMQLNELKRIKSDSIRYTKRVDSLNILLINVEKKRKYERNQFLQKQSEYNNLVNDSSFIAVLDSIKKVCCPDSTSR